MKRILAFDLGTSAGHASYVDGLIQSGLIRTQPTRFESQAIRYIKFERAVVALFDVIKPDIVFFERVHRHVSTIASQVYGGYLTTLMVACEKRGVPFEGLSVQAIKKFAVGRGNAPKELMIAAAKKRFPDQEILSDDVADALWIMALGMDLSK